MKGKTVIEKLIVETTCINPMVRTTNESLGNITEKINEIIDKLNELKVTETITSPDEMAFLQRFDVVLPTDLKNGQIVCLRWQDGEFHSLYRAYYSPFPKNPKEGETVSFTWQDERWKCSQPNNDEIPKSGAV